MASHFFPKPREADLRDILGTEYPEGAQIDTEIQEEEIKDILRKLL